MTTGSTITAPGRARPARRALLILAALVIASMTLLSSSPASAHRGEQSYLYLDVGVEDLEGRVEFPYSDMREVFGLALDPPDSVQAELEDHYAELLDYIQTHTSIGADGRAWDLNFTGEVELLDEDGRSDGFGYAIFPFVVDVPAGTVPRELDIRFSPFFAEIENRDAIVLVANDWQTGVYAAEANELRIFDENSPSGTIDLGSPSQWKNFTGSIGLGVDHIRTGPDHIFFVMVLLLPSVMIFRSGWRPSDTFLAALWRVLKMASMFTLAHSITFTLAGVGLLPLPPSWLVESVIAISIAAAALHNLRPIFLNKEWLIAFLFGLFHGLGFASLVDSLDTSRAAQLVSLLGRNLGIEIGQVVVILVVFPVLFLLRRTRYYRPLFVAGSLGLAMIATVWAIERLIGADSGITDYVLQAVEWPRSLIVMVLATVAAAVVFSAERRAERLIPVGDGHDGYEPVATEVSTRVPSAR